MTFVIEEPTRRFYFAHPVNVYGKPLEEAIIALIESVFPNDVVENPNQPHHQEGYTKYAERAKQSSTKHKGMNYFYDEVLPHCDGCVAVPFLDGKMGLGVAGEVRWFVKRGLPVYVATPAKADITAEDIENFIANPLSGLFAIGPLSKDHRVDFLSWSEEKEESEKTRPQFVVPHLETRLRTWLVYNRQYRPYEEAHLVSMPEPPGFYPE